MLKGQSLSVQSTSAEIEADLPMEIAHLLLIDVVGYSKLLVNEQIGCLRELNQVVRGTECFRSAEETGKLLRLPTGDGMALVFFRTPEEPARCALEISRDLKKSPNIQVRMGIHSGPVTQVKDVNETPNIAGAGINVAQRVMECGDAGHILMSKRVADDLAEYRHWQPHLEDLGEFEVKHGLPLHLFNLCKESLGNPSVPTKLQRRIWKFGTTLRPVRGSWRSWALAITSLCVAGAIAVGIWVLFHHALRPLVAPDKSIAVLPFENLSDEKENAFFTEGVQDEILTDLARVADLKVISRTSVMRYRPDAKRNLRDIARSLGVAHILEGSVQRAGAEVKVSAQLIDARTDTQIWANKYERGLEDVFAIQSEIAEQIVGELKSKLSASEKAAIELPPTNDVAAYDLYVQAKSLIANAVFRDPRPENLVEAVRLLNEALKHDPLFFLAYYQLAHANDQIYLRGFDHTPARLALAEEAIQALQRLRPDAGETHLAVAKHLYWGYLDYDRARQELDLARSSLPNDPTVFLLTGYIDRRQGRWEDSTRNMERALELDPRNLLVLQQMSLTYENLRRYDDMISVLDRAIALAPDQVSLRVQRGLAELDWHADTKPLHSTIDSIVHDNPNLVQTLGDQWLFLALCERDPDAAQHALAGMSAADGCNRDDIPFPVFWCQGLLAQTRGDTEVAHTAFTRARAEVDKIVRDQPNYAKAVCALGMIDAALGRKKEAIEEGRRATELLPMDKDFVDGAVLVQYLAIIYAWSGEKDAALNQLSALVKLPGYLSYGQLRLDPYWDPLRGDPRFDQIIASLAPK